MTCTHENKVTKISEFNLLHGILKPSKRTENVNRHYSPILFGCMNTRKGWANFNNFLIILNGGYIYTLAIVKLIKTHKYDDLI